MEQAAATQLDTNGTTNRVNQILSVRDALFSEIANPQNCGQGPEARRLIAELQRVLPGFTPLSSAARDCSRNEAVISDYRARIDALIARASWNDAELGSIVNEARKARSTLTDLQQEISRSYSPSRIQQIGGILDSLQTQYIELLYRLGKKTNIDDFPDRLNIAGAKSLGNVYELPTLFFSRLGEVTTYVYLFIAFGFDVLLVYLFQLTTSHRVRKHAIDSAIAGAW